MLKRFCRDKKKKKKKKTVVPLTSYARSCAVGWLFGKQRVNL
jgi:hypothetical protein